MYFTISSIVKIVMTYNLCMVSYFVCFQWYHACTLIGPILSAQRSWISLTSAGVTCLPLWTLIVSYQMTKQNISVLTYVNISWLNCHCLSWRIFSSYLTLVLRSLRPPPGPWVGGRGARRGCWVDWCIRWLPTATPSCPGGSGPR